MRSILRLLWIRKRHAHIGKLIIFRIKQLNGCPIMAVVLLVPLVHVPTDKNILIPLFYTQFLEIFYNLIDFTRLGS